MTDLQLFLLKVSISEFNISSNDAPWRKIAFFIGLALIAGVITFLNVSKKIRNSRMFSEGKVGHFDEKTAEQEEFEKLTRKYQLTKPEQTLLHDILRSARSEPVEILNNRTMLDELFKQEYLRLSKEAQAVPEAVKELLTLFSTRNAIEFVTANIRQPANKPPNQRGCLRKEVKTPCVCVFTTTVKSHKKGDAKKKIVLTDKSFEGTTIDVSAGGCAITALQPVKAGSQFKIEFTLEKTKVTAFARALRVNNHSKETIVHIQFIKVPPKTQSFIDAYAYNYL